MSQLKKKMRTILDAQRAWAASRELTVDEQGYLEDYVSNLRTPLSPSALAAFTKGSGGELVDSKRGKAKMRALHSSSALAVNVFDFWTNRDLEPVLKALQVKKAGTSLHFEEQLPTGAGGIPPNLDVVIRLEDGGLVGIESKFTEWMTPKRYIASTLAPYIEVDRRESYWSKAGLPKSHELAIAIFEGGEKFEYLNVPQLLKHSLGLRRDVAVPAVWCLRYIFFDAECGARAHHAKELSRFTNAVGEELGFLSLSYQKLINSFGDLEGEDAIEFRAHLTERYFTNV